ncbi:hypothetical protein AB0I77_37060 [Streptomyces sp. NPDC050619]|uniref:hypothetical protein n=1 Tax=Streptomyces sp. NPDC050619 TaxID=3157214 RepID=UPI00343B2A44
MSGGLLPLAAGHQGRRRATLPRGAAAARPSNPPLIIAHHRHRALDYRGFAAVTEAGYDDVTVAQSKLLQRVYADALRFGELAEPLW